MANLKHGTTIGGYLSYHNGNSNKSTVNWATGTLTASGKATLNYGFEAGISGAKVLEAVSGGVTTYGNHIIENATPILYIRDNNSTGVSQLGYISFRNSANSETAWVGLTSGTGDFSIYNSLGSVRLFNTGSVKFETTATGTLTTGYQDVTSGYKVNGTTVIDASKYVTTPRLIVGNQINTNSSNVELNYQNGDGTTTSFKNTTIRDGKNAMVTNFVGSTKLLDHRGSLAVTGAGTFGGDMKSSSIHIDSATGYIINNTGTLYFKNEADNQALYIKSKTGGVDYNGFRAYDKGGQIYYDSSIKFETTTTGTKTSGDSVVTGTGTFGGDVNLVTGAKAGKYNGRLASLIFTTVPTEQQGSERFDLYTSTCTDANDPGDGHLKTFFWDTTGRFDSQFFIGNALVNGLKWRVRSNDAYGDWTTVRDTANFVSGVDYSPAHTHPYLPLAGGVITSASWGNQLTIKRTDGAPSIYFEDNLGNKKSIYYKVGVFTLDDDARVVGTLTVDSSSVFKGLLTANESLTVHKNITVNALDGNNRGFRFNRNDTDTEAFIAFKTGTSENWLVGLDNDATNDFTWWNIDLGRNELKIHPTGGATFAGAISVLGGNSTEWNTAYGWGNHANGGYVQAITSDFRFSLNLGGGIDSRWYKVATVNLGSGGLHIKGSLGNHVENFGTQQFDLSIYGRNGGDGTSVAVNGNFNVSSGNVGIMVSKTTNTDTYHNYNVYIRTTNYTQCEIDVRALTNATIYKDYNYVSVEPSDLGIIFDNTSLSNGFYTVSRNTIIQVSTVDHSHSYLPLAGGVVSGELAVNAQLRARKDQTVGGYTTAALWTESYGATTTGIAFHISGNVGKFLEMRTDGVLYWENSTILHSGNFVSGTNYAPAHTHPYLSTGGGTITGNLTVTKSTPMVDIRALDESIAILRLCDHEADTTQMARLEYNSSTSNALRFYVNSTSVGLTLDSSGNLTATGDVTAFSDGRLKSILNKTNEVMDKVMDINIYDYERTDLNDGKLRTGVIAQELQELFPQFVLEGDDDDKTLSVNYSKLVSISIKAIQELKTELDEVKSELNELKNKNL